MTETGRVPLLLENWGHGFCEGRSFFFICPSQRYLGQCRVGEVANVDIEGNVLMNFAELTNCSISIWSLLLTAQFIKLNLVPRTQILGPFGPPKKRVNFDICNKRQKWVFCDSVNLTHYVFKYKLRVRGAYN